MNKWMYGPPFYEGGKKQLVHRHDTHLVYAIMYAGEEELTCPRCGEKAPRGMSQEQDTFNCGGQG